MPKISVGMPVLNAEKTVSAALDNLLAQSFADFEILVCDNASDDDTRTMIERYAKSDVRVQPKFFEERVDVRQSFKRALDVATAPYFMFAPADDRWYPEFMKKNLAALENAPDLVASTGQVAFFSEGALSYVSDGTQALTKSREENLRSFFLNPHENARLFSLFRREAMEGVFPDKIYPGWDFQMTARLISKGGFFEIDEILSERDQTPLEKYIIEAENYFGRRPLKLVPLSKYAFELLRDANLPSVKGRTSSLIKLLSRSHLSYSKYRLPKWHRLIQRLISFVDLDVQREPINRRSNFQGKI